VPYFVSALVLGVVFVGFAARLWRTGTRPAARSTYLYSMLYLFLLFIAMAVDRVVGGF
jgi:protoheme IX farnesyltransferase